MRNFVLIATCLVYSCASQSQETNEDPVQKLATVLMAFNPGAANGRSLPATKQTIGRSAMQSPIAMQLGKEIKELCRDDESSGCDLDMIEALKAASVSKKRESIISKEMQELCRDDESSGCDLDMIEALSGELEEVTDESIEELCRDDESSGCDLDMIEALKAVSVAKKRKNEISKEIQELCRDDESSGCDLDMIEALSGEIGSALGTSVEELCRDDESSGCDLDMIEALKKQMIERAGKQLKVKVRGVAAEKVDDYGLPV